MFKSDRIIALDIGTSKIVLAEFTAGKTGAPALVSYGVAALDVEPESDADVSAFVVAGIRDVMREQAVRPAPLFMTVSGLAVFPRYVKLPPVTRDKVEQIIRYEAEQNVPFPIEEVVWDYQLIEGDAGEMNVMLVAVKTESIMQLTNCVEAAGLEPEIVDVGPMALYNIVRYNYPDLPGCTMALDIGARSSNVIFVEEDRIFSRSIPVAGNAITQDIMKELGVPFREAEQLKREHAFVALGGVYAGHDNETADRISKTVRNVVTRLHAEVNRSINFYRSQQGGSPPSLTLLTGGSAVIPHMDTFFREKLKVEVEYLNPFINLPVSERIDGDRIADDVHLLSGVAGLALRRSLICPVEVNLMPPHIVDRKVFRRRQPFFALAALGVVCIMLCWWVYFHRMQAMLGARQVKVEERIGNLTSISRQMEQARAERETARGKADRIVGVVGRRTRWIGLLESVHSCMIEGMWLRSVRPVVENGAVARVEISGRGFVDQLVDTAVEDLRNRLTGTDLIAEATITRLPVVSPRDYARDFTISAVLSQPIQLR